MTTPGGSGSSVTAASDLESFQRIVVTHRGEVLRHCYRMLGSWTEAEDCLQEALIRAWRGLPRFEGRASVRSWLYTIATNACLTALGKRRRRALPQDAARPALPGQAVAAAVDGRLWIEPFPDRALGSTGDVEALAVARESVTLAFVLALQHLAPRQRAVLLLRDVVGYDAREVAAMLGMSVAAANSAAGRARAGLARARRSSGRDSRPGPLDGRQRALLKRYLEAWEGGDVRGLVALLTHDASFSMPPIPTWFRGRPGIAAVLAKHVFAGGRRFRLEPTSAAGGRAAFVVLKAERGESKWQAHGVQVLWLEGPRVGSVVTFLNPRLARAYRLPAGPRSTTGR